MLGGTQGDKLLTLIWLCFIFILNEIIDFLVMYFFCFTDLLSDCFS